MVIGEDKEIAEAYDAETVVSTSNDELAMFHYNYDLASSQKGDPDYWDNYMSSTAMSSFLNAAYQSPDGYAIRTNPVTGMKEMMIAGTHSPTTAQGLEEWGSNITEGLEHAVTFGHSDLVANVDGRKQFAADLEHIAHEEGVEVVYGHSRGAAILSHFDPTEFIGIGLDGASFIGDKNSGFINIRSNQVFDSSIGAFKKNTVVLKKKKFHDVTTQKKVAKKKKLTTKSDKLAKKTGFSSKGSGMKTKSAHTISYTGKHHEELQEKKMKRKADKLSDKLGVGSTSGMRTKKVNTRSGKYQKVEKPDDGETDDDLRRRLSSKVTKKNLLKKKSRKSKTKSKKRKLGKK